MGATPDKPLTSRKAHGPRKGPTVYLTDPLSSIYVYVNVTEDEAQAVLAKSQRGTVTFTTTSGRHIYGTVRRCTFPAGTWKATVGALGDNGYGITDVVNMYPPELDPDLVARLNGQVQLSWITADEDAKKMRDLMKGSEGQKVRIVIAYSRTATGNSRTLSETIPLVQGNNSVLADPFLAEMYLQFVEHFGHVTVDFNLAKDGLTQEEIEWVEEDRPEIINITNLFVAGATDFQTAKASANPPAKLMHLRAMLEAIFFQRQVKNDLALRNLLKISMGQLMVTDASGKISFKADIGVLRVTQQGANALLLYDRFGAPVRGFAGPMDHEYRSVDLDKIERDISIPHFDLAVSDRGLYLVLRSLEQQLATPVREVEALVASLYKHTIFISNEVHRRYNGQIAERILEFAPFVIGFFVVHAIASRLLASHPVAFLAYMALVKAAGLIFALDFTLVNMARLAEAGAHFNRLEEIHREKDEDPTLTKLSEHHLAAGSVALIDAMADFIALGVYIAGGVALKTKPGRALKQGLKNAAMAGVELVTDGYRAIEIKLRKPKTTIEAQIPSQKNAGELVPPPPTPDEPPAHKPIEQPNAGVAQEEVYGKQPAQVPLEVNRPRALDMSAAELAADEAAKLELYQAAEGVKARQNAFIKALLDELGVSGEGKSILKRDGRQAFIQGVLDKVGIRKKGKYKTVGEMTDMVRGRVNLDDPAQVEYVVSKLASSPQVSKPKISEPLERVGVENGYPRYHVDITDPQTGIKHEWQIGTRQTTRLYQDPGIDVGKLKIEPENQNIHDVEYDIFKTIDEPDPTKLPADEVARLLKLSADTGIRAFRVKVAELSSRLGTENLPEAELTARIQELHKEAGDILKMLIEMTGGDPAGVEFINSFLH